MGEIILLVNVYGNPGGAGSEVGLLVLKGAEEKWGDRSISYIGCELTHDSYTMGWGASPLKNLQERARRTFMS